MNNAQNARNHIFPRTAKTIAIKCNCGKIDIVNILDFIVRCEHTCSAQHSERDWFHTTVTYQPYNAYWCILKYSGGINPRLTEEERYKLVIKQVYWEDNHAKRTELARSSEEPSSRTNNTS